MTPIVSSREFVRMRISVTSVFVGPEVTTMARRQHVTQHVCLGLTASKIHKGPLTLS